MIHLGLDTSLGACSAALFDSASGQLLAADIKIIERGHAEVLGPMVEAIFASAGLRPIDLHRVIVTRGPGTFTGLRIGLAFAKGLALARGLPLLGIDSLWASAAPHFETATSIVVAHKAGATGKFYVGCFEGSTGKEIGPHALLSRDALQRRIEGIGRPMVIGSGFAEIANEWPDAARFLPVAMRQPDDPDSSQPLYLREPDAKPLALQGKTVPSLRLARAADAAVLSHLHERCFATSWTPEMLRVTAAAPNATTLIAENRGEACGFIQARAAADEAEILTLCVLPLLRRHGLGLLLLGGLVTDLKMRGIKTLFLEVAAGNTGAIGLYRLAGFRETGRRKGYYAKGQEPAEDAITMAKVITP
jgi:tRNA threonylcarbamoyl adenosine modification protein YeaZ/ribosomal-protein-alanine acetyltransferase